MPPGTGPGASPPHDAPASPGSTVSPAPLLGWCAVLMAFSCFTTQAGLNIAFCVACIGLVHRICRHGLQELVGLPGADLPLGLYAFSFLLSSTAGIDPMRSFEYGTEFKRILIAYVVASSVRTTGEVIRLFGAVILGGLVNSALTFHQWAFVGTYARTNLTQTYEPFQLTQPFGLASSCNDLAGLLVQALGLAVAPALVVSLGPGRRAALGLIAATISLGILRTGSRSGLVGALLALFITVLWYRPRLVPWIAAALALIYPLIPGSLTSRHFQIFDAKVKSNTFRLRMCEVSVQMARDHQPLGIGRRNFEPLHDKIRRPDEELSPNAHNNYLNVMVEMGLLGVVSLIWFQCAVIRYLARQIGRADRSDLHRAALLGLFMAFVSFAIVGLFDFFWGFSMPVSLMWILVGTAYAVGEGNLLDGRAAAPASR
ncbi:MAG: O-antigen ligase family protein [Candidatus Riflebacteria bacterium]|nr:O-antigen ligase family protein [Candidatus Riflebacteria bacterium]